MTIVYKYLISTVFVVNAIKTCALPPLVFFSFLFIKKGLCIHIHECTVPFILCFTYSKVSIFIPNVCLLWVLENKVKFKNLLTQLWPVKLILTVKLGNTNLHNLDAYYSHFWNNSRQTWLEQKMHFHFSVSKVSSATQFPFFPPVKATLSSEAFQTASLFHLVALAVICTRTHLRAGKMTHLKMGVKTGRFVILDPICDFRCDLWF